MPPTEDQFLTDILMTLGYCDVRGETVVPFSPTHILDWCKLTGWHLSSWQGETIFLASVAYVETSVSKNPPPPWVEENAPKVDPNAIRRVFQMVNKSKA